MLKIRVMGTRRDLKWIRRLFERWKVFSIRRMSEIYSVKGSDRYYRMYVDVCRIKKE